MTTIMSSKKSNHFRNLFSVAFCYENYLIHYLTHPTDGQCCLHPVSSPLFSAQQEYRTLNTSELPCSLQLITIMKNTAHYSQLPHPVPVHHHLMFELRAKNKVYWCGASGGIRTPDLCLRRATLYPAELQMLAIFYTNLMSSIL